MEFVPSIKGSIFGNAVEDLLKLIGQRELSRSELETALGSEGMLQFDQSIQPTRWYDVATYGRMLEVLRDLVGDGQDTYLNQRGAESADALLENGMYQQMEYLSRTQVASASTPDERFRAFGRDLNLLVSLHRAIMNFGAQTATIDPDHADRYVIEFADSIHCPDPLCYTTTGFMNRMAKQHGPDDLWTWSRPDPNLILFRMTRTA